MPVSPRHNVGQQLDKFAIGQQSSSKEKKKSQHSTADHSRTNNFPNLGISNWSQKWEDGHLQEYASLWVALHWLRPLQPCCPRLPARQLRCQGSLSPRRRPALDWGERSCSQSRFSLLSRRSQPETLQVSTQSREEFGLWKLVNYPYGGIWVTREGDVYSVGADKAVNSG